MLRYIAADLLGVDGGGYDGSSRCYGLTPSTSTSGPSLRATSLARSPSTTARQRAGWSRRTTITWATPPALAAAAIVLAGRRVIAAWPQASEPPFSRDETARCTCSCCSDSSLRV